VHVQETPGSVRVPVLVGLGVIAAALGTCSAFVPRCPLRHVRTVGTRAAAGA
jgi:hypothetical protein